jgi:Protein of unknown function (DUF1559)
MLLTAHGKLEESAMFDFTCSTCRKHVQADDSFAGKRVLCPACDAAMTAPTAASSAITAHATIGHPTSTGAFAEGLPPLHDERPPMIEVPVFARWLPYIIVGVVAAVAIALIIPAVQKVREAAARTQSINNVKQIVLAMHNFHDAYKFLPFNGTKPAAPCDGASGSWAFMIMPYIDSNPIFAEVRTDLGVATFLCPGRGRPSSCTGAGGPGAWTDYFINPFLNDPNGNANAPDMKRTMEGITDGAANTIFVGHGQMRPDDYESPDAIPGFTTTIFNGGNSAMCRGNRQVSNRRDFAESTPGNWGGPFSQGSLMAMGDGVVRMFPYTMGGGNIVNGVCDGARDPNSFGSFLTPSGGEVVVLVDN